MNERAVTAFAEDGKTKTAETVKASHGGSGAQARPVIDDSSEATDIADRVGILNCGAPNRPARPTSAQRRATKLAKTFLDGKWGAPPPQLCPFHGANRRSTARIRKEKAKAQAAMMPMPTNTTSVARNCEADMII